MSYYNRKARNVNHKFSTQVDFFYFPVQRRSLPQLQRQHGRQDHERGDECERAVGHRQQIAHAQIGVIAEQGGKLAQHCRQHQLRPRGRQRERERIGGEEIPVVHMRQEKRDRDREQRRRQHERPVGAIVPVQPEPDGQQHDHECGCADAELCGDLGVAHLRKERKDGRGVIVEPGADAARLLKRDG